MKANQTVSSQEVVKILDEKGSDTGKTCSRDKIHSTQQWHPVVHIWLVNSKGEVLLQKRAKDKSQYANVWHISAAGHMTADETPEEAAVKETNEELGLSIQANDLIKLGARNVSQIIPEEGVRDKERVNLFLLKRDLDIGKLSFQSEELQKVKFYPLDSLKSDIIDPVKSKQYLNHPKDYYLETIGEIKKLIKLMQK